MTSAGALPLAQDLVPVAQQRRQEVAQDRPRAGLDFDRYRHAGRQIDHLLVDLHLRTVQRNTGAVVQFLALRLAGLVSRPLPAVLGPVSLPVTDDGVLRDAEHLALQEAVAGEIESIDLDLGFLSGTDKADVAVR